MPEADLHPINFASLSSEILLELGEDFVRALPSATRDPPRSRMEEGWMNSISDVVSRAKKFPGRLPLRDARALAESFQKAMQYSHLSSTNMRDLWMRVHAHAVLRGSNVFPDMELCDGSPAYEPLGFVDVWKANYHGDEVCVKVIRTRNTLHLEEIKNTFYDEVEGCKKFSHPNVLPVMQVSNTLFPLCIMTPWMPDGNIMQYIKTNPDANRFMLLTEACNGLLYLHALNILHGCISPGNILITREGRACLGDFGTVGVFHDRSLTRFKLETVCYMAPERADLLKTLPSKESDVYSIAMASFKILTRVPPYDDVRGHFYLTHRIKAVERPPRPINLDTIRWLPDNVWDMITVCWDEDPRRRWRVSAIHELFSTLSFQHAQRFKSVKVGRQQRGRTLPRRFASVFQGLLDSEPEAKKAVNALDERLEDRTIPDGERRRLFNELCKMCSEHKVVPKSMHIPDCSEGAVEVDGGGYSNVFRGRYDEREVAIKVVHLYIVNLEIVLRRFCREAVAWKHLRHPNILPMLGVTMSEQRLAMVSEWMENGNINQFVAKEPQANRTALLVDVAKGLKYMHDLRVVHGDLKGANILINNDRRACVADFGLSTITRVATHDPTLMSSISDTSLMSFTAGGTSRWMSPEMLDPEHFGMPPEEGDRPTRQSDCWAFGMAIYEVLCGYYPYTEIESNFLVQNAILEGTRPKKPAEAGRLGFTDELWTVVERSWEVDRDKRPKIEDILSCLSDATGFWYMRGSDRL